MGGLVETLGSLLATPKGSMRLRPIQAQALFDLGTVGGLFAPLRVGSGKTLISFLAPTVVFSTRPLLLVPAKLLTKTQKEKEELSQHWDIGFLRIMSYEWLGRVQAADALERYQPDLIIADECHKLRNLNAAVTRRVGRWFRSSETTKCVAMSGTITKRSIHDYSHILKWIYGPTDYPLPVTLAERGVWADALDGRKNQQFAYPGALRLFCDDVERAAWVGNAQKMARSAYRRHLVSTPGIVATKETPVDASLIIQASSPAVSTQTDLAFDRLRDDWETPDGWPMVDGLEMFRHARELALGFYYRWEPRPEPEWLEPRKAWCSFVRSKIKNSNQWDSELQVRRAFPRAKALRDWLEVKDTFVPNTVPVWLDDYLIPFVKTWAKKNRGIVWTEHRCVGQRLEAETGLVYYGRRGLSSIGKSIEDHPKGEPLIASIKSNGEGRNLQAWCSNLVLSPPPNGSQWEQLIGRTHREGQEADEVSVDVVMTCIEHVTAFSQAVEDCEYVQESTGSPQKILLAGVSVLRIADIVGEEARWKFK